MAFSGTNCLADENPEHATDLLWLAEQGGIPPVAYRNLEKFIRSTSDGATSFGAGDTLLGDVNSHTSKTTASEGQSCNVNNETDTNNARLLNPEVNYILVGFDMPKRSTPTLPICS